MEKAKYFMKSQSKTLSICKYHSAEGIIRKTLTQGSKLQPQKHR